LSLIAQAEFALDMAKGCLGSEPATHRSLRAKMFCYFQPFQQWHIVGKSPKHYAKSFNR
jgi:hypothetical protein